MTKSKIDLLDIYSKDKHFVHKLLIYNFKIPLDALDENKNTLLDIMIMNEDIKGVELLFNYIKQFKNFLDYINFQNKDGNTAIHIAVMINNIKLAEMLENIGAKLNIKNNNNEIVQILDNENSNSNFIPSNSNNNNNNQSTFNDSIISNIDSDDKITSGFLVYMAENKLIGGKTVNISGTRNVNDNESDNNKTDSLELSSDFFNIQMGGKESIKNDLHDRNRPSNDIHKEVMDNIMKQGFSEDDARYIKAGIYAEVKNKFSNLSNLQRALKLKELTTEAKIKEYGSTHQLEKLKKEVDKARETRKNSTPKMHNGKHDMKDKMKESKVQHHKNKDEHHKNKDEHHKSKDEHHKSKDKDKEKIKSSKKKVKV